MIIRHLPFGRNIVEMHKLLAKQKAELINDQADDMLTLETQLYKMNEMFKLIQVRVTIV